MASCLKTTAALVLVVTVLLMLGAVFLPWYVETGVTGKKLYLHALYHYTTDCYGSSCGLYYGWPDGGRSTSSISIDLKWGPAIGWDLSVAAAGTVLLYAILKLVTAKQQRNTGNSQQRAVIVCRSNQPGIPVGYQKQPVVVVERSYGPAPFNSPYTTSQNYAPTAAVPNTSNHSSTSVYQQQQQQHFQSYGSGAPGTVMMASAPYEDNAVNSDCSNPPLYPNLSQQYGQFSSVRPPPFNPDV